MNSLAQSASSWLMAPLNKLASLFKPAEPEEPPVPLMKNWWKNVGSVWEKFPHVPTMLTGQEFQLLYWLGTEGYKGRGSIVELGPFLGGSTKCLAAGLQQQENPKQKVHVYDYFKYDPYYDHWFKPMGFDLKDGDNFVHVYQHYNREIAHLIELHQGNLLEASYNAGPIEILFVDIAKIWDVNDRVIKMFFPHLMVNKSFVVQQDILHYWSYWLVITMHYYKDYFERLTQVEHGSTVLYRYVKKIPKKMIRFDIKTLPMKKKCEAFEEELERNTGWQHVQIQVAYYRMLKDFGEHAAAKEIAKQVDRTVDDVAVRFIKEEDWPSA